MRSVLNTGKTWGKRVAGGAARSSRKDEQAAAEGQQKAGRRDVLLAGAAALVAGTTLPPLARSEDAPIIEGEEVIAEGWKASGRTMWQLIGRPVQTSLDEVKLSAYHLNNSSSSSSSPSDSSLRRCIR